MALSDLSNRERELVRRCMQAAADGPYFPDWEFLTIMGVSRDEVRTVCGSWPQVDESRERVRLSINNTLNNLTGYPHGMTETLEAEVGADMEEIERVFRKWRGDADHHRAEPKPCT